MTIEESLEQLESGIKRLKVHYDMFFTGALKRQPFEQRKQVDQSIRALAATSIKRYHQRFQLNTLVGRYNMLCELWAKQLRALEEGGRAAAYGASQSSRMPPAPEPHSPRSPGAPPILEGAAGSSDTDGERVLFSVRVTDPEAEPEMMRALYERYLDARTSEQGRPQIKLESFVKQVSRQASSLKASTGCDTLEFRVLLKGDSVSLKARTGK